METIKKNITEDYIIKNKKQGCLILLAVALIVSLVIAFVLFIVTRPALLESFVLRDSANTIGGAIGGIGTVIIGVCTITIAIANVIMLYMTFKNQYEANEQRKNEIKKQEEEKNVNEFRKRLANIQNHWNSIQLESVHGRFLGIDAIDEYVSSYKDIDNKKSFTMRLFLIYQDLFYYLDAIKNMEQNNNIQQLYSQAQKFYEHYMEKTCKTIINLLIEDDNQNESEEWREVYKNIEKLLLNK